VAEAEVIRAAAVTDREEEGLPQELGLDEIRDMLDIGAQLIEVLPSQEYAEEHLPGAVNVPLKSLDAETTRQIDPGRPVIVYCWDFQ
jgi:rhodanese-related sulfurtransferase